MIMRHLTPLLFTIFLCCLPALAGNTKNLIVSSSSPEVEPIEIYRGSGVTINYANASQTIESAWLDNESVIGITANGCFAGANAATCGKKDKATVLHVKQLYGSVYRGRGKKSLLTVETLDSSKKLRIYRYDLKPLPGSAPEDALTLLEYSPALSLPTPSTAEGNLPPPQAIGARLRGGLARAQGNNLVNDPNLLARINKLIVLVESGIPPAEAARQAGVSPALVNSLYR
jgi:hypothetical protein